MGKYLVIPDFQVALAPEHVRGYHLLRTFDGMGRHCSFPACCIANIKIFWTSKAPITEANIAVDTIDSRANLLLPHKAMGVEKPLLPIFPCSQTVDSQAGHDLHAR